MAQGKGTQELMDRERWLTPSDNEALSRYFTARAHASPEMRLKMEAAFDEALDAGERMKVCAERALALVA